MERDMMSIEDNPTTTFFHEMFFDCKTWEFTSRNDKRKKRFVECVERTDDANNIVCPEQYQDLSIINAVRKLLNEKEMDFFYDPDEEDVTPLTLDNQVYYVKAKDITKKWPNHYYLRARRPLLGFKAVREDGSSVMSRLKNPSRRYKVGEVYNTEEDDILNSDGSPIFFSLSYEKACSYLQAGYKMFLIVASGLIFIKNNWDDMGASSLLVLKELSLDEMNNIGKYVYVPRIFWIGGRWDSYDQEISDQLWEYS